MKTLTILGVLLVSLAGCTTAESPGDIEILKVTANKELVSSFFEKFSNGEIDAAFTMVSDDVRWWVPGNLPFSGTKSKAEYLQVVGAIKQGFPEGLSLTPTSMIGEGNTVAVEVESAGRHVNGKAYNNKYHFLIVIDGQEIVNVKEYMDTLHLYQLITPEI